MIMKLGLMVMTTGVTNFIQVIFSHLANADISGLKWIKRCITGQDMHEEVEYWNCN
jgi:hypothetical protein